MSKYTADKSKKATWIVKNEYDAVTGKCTTTYTNSDKKVNHRRERTIDPDKHLEQYIKITTDRMLRKDANVERSVMHCVNAMQRFTKYEETRLVKQKAKKDKYGDKKQSPYYRTGKPKKNEVPEKKN